MGIFSRRTNRTQEAFGRLVAPPFARPLSRVSSPRLFVSFAQKYPGQPSHEAVAYDLLLSALQTRNTPTAEAETSTSDVAVEGERIP
eukprot:9479266-Pyramimonas_sp.AAC.1